MDYSNPIEQLPDFYSNGPQIDGKLLIDAVPRRPIDRIATTYREASAQTDFDPDKFYQENFECPDLPAQGLRALPGRSADEHIEAMWSVLARHTPNDRYTQVGLPNKTIVPGERFSESYYWDSYFAMIGLASAGKWDMVEGMVDNCAYQINRFGYVPNGARQYYLGRSQPPVFSHMVRLLAKHNAEVATEAQQDEAAGYGATLVNYLPQMIAEHRFWMDGREDLIRGVGETALKRVVLMPDGSMLNRYFDANPTPRPESYRQDIINAERAGIEHPGRPNEYYRNIRAAAESGWDFSGRWCEDGKTLKTVNTINIVPIDLNSLLYDLEKTIEEGLEYAGELALASYYHLEAAKRAAAINRYQYDANKGFYYDYHRIREEHTDYPSMAAAFPLQSGIASQEQADAVANRLKNDFLRPGGFATTLHETNEQWDGENGWAPPQEVARRGLLRYGHSALAAIACQRWVNRNLELFERTRQFHEKVHVGDKVAAGDGGEYSGQTGFGWTNGVLLEQKKNTPGTSQAS